METSVKGILVTICVIIICIPDFFTYTVLIHAEDEKLKIERLIRDLGSRNANIQNKAIQDLVQIGQLSVNSLIKTWAEDEMFVGGGAQKAIVKIGELAVGSLIEALEDENGRIRRYAAETLGLIKDPRAIKPLIHTLQEKPEWGSYRYRYSASVYVSAAAARALGMIKDPRAVEPLIMALGEKIDGAAQALGERSALCPFNSFSYLFPAFCNQKTLVLIVQKSQE